jgi:uncharacterized protein (DUF1501 family)
MTQKMTLTRGDVVLIPFPYTDLSARKRRPVLILNEVDEYVDFLAVAVTSQPDHADALALEPADVEHGSLPKLIAGQCLDVDQATAALIKDLKLRGMLEDTLVVFGGEFGRTVYSQGALTKDNYGRDHHPKNFCMWMAGGGVKGGLTYGETDDFSYNAVENSVHLNDLNATILHCLGINDQRFTYPFQGLEQRLTGVEHAHLIKDILV